MAKCGEFEVYQDAFMCSGTLLLDMVVFVLTFIIIFGIVLGLLGKLLNQKEN